jgi:hypothetical protein
MGGSLRFTDLNKVGVKGRLMQVIDRIDFGEIAREALEYIRANAPEDELIAALRVKDYSFRVLAGWVLDRAVDYIVLDRAWEKLIPHIVAAAMSEMLWSLARRGELARLDIEKYSKLLREYAERYSDETADGLLKFAKMVGDVIRELRMELGR